jgi:hypothetical protein
MSVKQELEQRIVGAVIDGALEAGYSLSVHNGVEYAVEHSRDKTAVLAALFTPDVDLLYVTDGKVVLGWVSFIYGHNGWDVVSDYTANLETMMTAANALKHKYVV